MVTEQVVAASPGRLTLSRITAAAGLTTLVLVLGTSIANGYQSASFTSDTAQVMTFFRSLHDPLGSADEVADRLLDSILEDLEIPGGSRVVVLLNGLGATPQEELYVLYRRVHERLGKLGIEVQGEFIQR